MTRRTTARSRVHASQSGIVVVYNDDWPRKFQTVRANLWPAVARFAVAVEHVGSTAVPGLAAKPIIDVDVVVPDLSCVPRAIAALESLGYEHQGDPGVPGRDALSVLPGLPEHHLYVVVRDSPAHRDHVDLRDYLRKDSDAAQRYATEKRRLAQLVATDRKSYVAGKAWLVRKLLAAARAT